jgi:hypothetical protein
MTTELQTINFHGDTLTAAVIDNVPHVSVRHVCDALEVSYPAQFRKLKSSSWASVALKATGDARELAMIPAKNLPMWMVTIRPSRVKPSLRGKIELYQQEAADVLARHFTPAVAPLGYDAEDEQCVILHNMLVNRMAVVALQREQKRHLELINEVQATAERAEEKADVAFRAFNGGAERYQVLGWALKHGLAIPQGQLSAIGRKLTKYCRDRDIVVETRTDPKYGKVNVYPEAVCRANHDEFVSRA